MSDAPKRSARSDLAWGFGAQFMQNGAALLLLPVLAARVSSTELGLWFVFMTIQSLVALLDVGFGSSLARSFCYIFAGATQILRHGIQQDAVAQDVDLRLLAKTIRMARTIYAIVASIVALVLLIPGTIYIFSLGAGATTGGIVAWALYAVAIVLNVYFQWYLPLLVGAGKVRESYKATVIIRASFTLTAAVFLQFHAALWVVSAAYLSAVVLMLCYVTLQTSEIFARLPRARVPYEELKENFLTLWHNSYRTGLTAIGGFFITKFSVLLVSSHYGLTVSASYAFTLQIFSAITAMALVPFGALLPRIAAHRLKSSEGELRRLLGSAFMITWALALLAIATVLLFGRPALAAFHARTNLLPPDLLALVALTAFLELNHGAAAAVIAATNRIPFVRAAVFSGMVICGLSTLAAMRGYPLWTILVIQMLTQLAYNNWKWPLIIYREYRFTRRDFTSSVGLLLRQRSAP